MFILQITLDRHNARLKLNYCPLPDPPNFSLPFTVKDAKKIFSYFFLITYPQADLSSD
jgi:hypothetical protein